ncbi:MAG: hypothetical protein J2P35_08685 [Actinobacteria bacterium]|nr:hypothetical protein [Actinomycetota bacterium]MBO0818055.1 hypothetical protein [Actinomycetota bacterium]
MHPTITQAVAAEQRKDLITRATAARLARDRRRARRRSHQLAAGRSRARLGVTPRIRPA